MKEYYLRLRVHSNRRMNKPKDWPSEIVQAAGRKEEQEREKEGK